MGTLSQRQTANLISGLQQQMQARSTDELRSEAGIKSVLTAVANANGFDAESINSDFGTVTKYDYSKDAKIMGANDDALKGFKAESGSIDVESFDVLNSQNLEQIQLAAINIAGNNLKVEEDGIVALFSKETVAGNVTGKSFDSANPKITIGATNKNGIAIGGDRVSLIANLDNRTIFSRGKRSFKPVLRSTGDYKTSGYLLANVAEYIDYNGTSVQTSPIAVGLPVPLRLVCSTDQYLTEHTDGFNANVTLSEEASIRNVYLTFIGEDSAQAVLTNILLAKVIGMSGTRFSTVGQGNGKDIIANFTGRIRVKASDFAASKALKYTSKANETVITNTGDEELVLEFTVNASINTDTMKLTSSATSIQLVALFDGIEEIAKTESTFTDMAAIVAKASISGVDFDLSLSNTNNADNGIIVDVEEEVFELPAVIKQPVSIRKSVIGDVPADKIAGYLASAKVTASAVKAVELLDLIDDFIDANKDKVDAEGFIKDAQLDGIGRNYIKPMLIQNTISALNRNTRRSGETKEDISTYIYDVITTKALEVFTKSNLDKAIDVLATGERPTLIITTGANVASYIKHAIDNNKNGELKFDVKVETSYQLASRVLATFKIQDKIYECSPLMLVEGPDFIYKGQEKDGNNGNSDVTKLVPRRGAMVNAPILFDYNVTGIVAALDK